MFPHFWPRVSDNGRALELYEGEKDKDKNENPKVSVRFSGDRGVVDFRGLSILEERDLREYIHRSSAIKFEVRR